MRPAFRLQMFHIQNAVRGEKLPKSAILNISSAKLSNLLYCKSSFPFWKFFQLIISISTASEIISLNSEEWIFFKNRLSYKEPLHRINVLISFLYL